MRRCLMSMALLLGAVTPALAALQQGDRAPDFAAAATRDGKTVPYALKDALQRGPVVVYFFPTAYGGGCSVQAHEFAEHIDQLRAAGASIVGISLDSIERLNEFSADPRYCAGKFPVASDSDGRIARAYQLAISARDAGAKDNRGVAVSAARVERTTFVIGRDGRIVATVGGVSAAENVEQTLAVLRRYAAAAVQP